MCIMWTHNFSISISFGNNFGTKTSSEPDKNENDTVSPEKFQNYSDKPEAQNLDQCSCCDDEDTQEFQKYNHDQTNCQEFSDSDESSTVKKLSDIEEIEDSETCLCLIDEGDNLMQVPENFSISEPVEPGRGLLAYSERLSTFCKPTRDTEEKKLLLEVPRDAECFPKERPENQKLCFIDDPPYSPSVTPYRPDYISDLDKYNNIKESEDTCICSTKIQSGKEHSRRSSPLREEKEFADLRSRPLREYSENIRSGSSGSGKTTPRSYRPDNIKDSEDPCICSTKIQSGKENSRRSSPLREEKDSADLRSRPLREYSENIRSGSSGSGKTTPRSYRPDNINNSEDTCICPTNIQSGKENSRSSPLREEKESADLRSRPLREYSENIRSGFSGSGKTTPRSYKPDNIKDSEDACICSTNIQSGKENSRRSSPLREENQSADLRSRPLREYSENIRSGFSGTGKTTPRPYRPDYVADLEKYNNIKDSDCTCPSKSENSKRICPPPEEKKFADLRSRPLTEYSENFGPNLSGKSTRRPSRSDYKADLEKYGKTKDFSCICPTNTQSEKENLARIFPLPEEKDWTSRPLTEYSENYGPNLSRKTTPGQTKDISCICPTNIEEKEFSDLPLRPLKEYNENIRSAPQSGKNSPRPYASTISIKGNKSDNPGNATSKPCACKACQTINQPDDVAEPDLKENSGRPCSCKICPRKDRSTDLALKESVGQDTTRACTCKVCPRQNRNIDLAQPNYNETVRQASPRPCSCTVCPRNNRNADVAQSNYNENVGRASPRPCSCTVCPKQNRNIDLAGSNFNENFGRPTPRPCSCMACHRENKFGDLAGNVAPRPCSCIACHRRNKSPDSVEPNFNENEGRSSPRPCSCSACQRTNLSDDEDEEEPTRKGKKGKSKGSRKKNKTTDAPEKKTKEKSGKTAKQARKGSAKSKKSESAEPKLKENAGKSSSRSGKTENKSSDLITNINVQEDSGRISPRPCSCKGCQTENRSTGLTEPHLNDYSGRSSPRPCSCSSCRAENKFNDLELSHPKEDAGEAIPRPCACKVCHKDLNENSENKSSYTALKENSGTNSAQPYGCACCTTDNKSRDVESEFLKKYKSDNKIWDEKNIEQDKKQQSEICCSKEYTFFRNSLPTWVTRQAH